MRFYQLGPHGWFGQGGCGSGEWSYSATLGAPLATCREYKRTQKSTLPKIEVEMKGGVKYMNIATEQQFENWSKFSTAKNRDIIYIAPYLQDGMVNSLNED